MNREIKFRVWDNVDYMSTPFTLQDLQTKTIQFTSDCIVMQYTGLKDKKNIPIYEGDIVTRKRFFASDIIYVGVVNFVDGCFIIEPEITLIHEYVYNVYEIEVIGNKFSNPELLKQ